MSLVKAPEVRLKKPSFESSSLICGGASDRCVLLSEVVPPTSGPVSVSEACCTGRLEARDFRFDGLATGGGRGWTYSGSGSSDLILAEAFLGDLDRRVLAGRGGGGGRSSRSSKGLLLLVSWELSTSKIPLLERFARARAVRILLDCGTSCSLKISTS